eukprot:scaffold9262_cov107-Cylindrotheca_fusiformis.AAC.6
MTSLQVDRMEIEIFAVLSARFDPTPSHFVFVPIVCQQDAPMRATPETGESLVPLNLESEEGRSWSRWWPPYWPVWTTQHTGDWRVRTSYKGPPDFRGENITQGITIRKIVGTAKNTPPYSNECYECPTCQRASHVPQERHGKPHIQKCSKISPKREATTNQIASL